MKKHQYPRLQDIIGLLNQFFPPSLAEDWDNVGLQVGDPESFIRRAVLALDPSEKVMQAAIDANAEAVICHHPLLFKPLKRVATTDAVGRTVRLAIRHDVSVFSLHTNLDRGRQGLNDWLGRQLGLQKCQPLLQGNSGELVKLITFVPRDHVDAVLTVLFKAGAGQIGNYDSCSFRHSGTGTFRPGEGTNPFLGRIGELEQADEIRLETIVPRERLGRVTRRLLEAHPYEEVAYDLVPLENRRPDIGLGRIGLLAEPTTLQEFASQVRAALGADHLRCVGSPAGEIRKVAVCGGSGASLLFEAQRQGANALVTGDIKYHEARQAEELGIALIDAGHFASERLMAGHLAALLTEEGRQRRWETEFLPLQVEQDPFHVVI